jgi:hypothetical protein
MRQGINQSTIMGWRQSRPMLLAALAVFFMVVMAVGPAPLQAAGKIVEVLLSDQADAKGLVAKHQDKFTPTTAEIKGAALIAGAEKGKQVTAELFYVTQNLKVLSITKDLPDAKEATFTFAFSKPTKGWPKGDYKVVISTSDGATKEVPFQVK